MLAGIVLLGGWDVGDVAAELVVANNGDEEIDKHVECLEVVGRTPDTLLLVRGDILADAVVLVGVGVIDKVEDGMPVTEGLALVGDISKMLGTEETLVGRKGDSEDEQLETGERIACSRPGDLEDLRDTGH